MNKSKLSDKINELILTFGYCGKAKYAPGTFGTIGATLVWYFLNEYFFSNNYSSFLQISFWIILSICLTFYAIYGIKKYQIFNSKDDIDDKSIVIDEAVGIFIALEILNVFTGYDITIISTTKHIFYIIVCFLLFRFFDIKKPWFIGTCDRKLKNSFGVMLDDILCGFIAGVISIIIYRATYQSGFFEIITCN